MTTLSFRFKSLEPSRIAEAIVNEKQLRSLDLWATGLDERGLATISRALAGAHGLAQLDLGDNPLSSAAVVELSRALTAAEFGTRLVLLCLSRCRLTDDVGRAFSEYLRGRSAEPLEILELRDNALENGAASQLSHALRYNRTLTHLDLFHNKIGDKGAAGFIGALQSNTSLRVLDLGCNLIESKSLLASIAKALQGRDAAPGARRSGAGGIVVLSERARDEQYRERVLRNEQEREQRDDREEYAPVSRAQRRSEQPPPTLTIEEASSLLQGAPLLKKDPSSPESQAVLKLATRADALLNRRANEAHAKLDRDVARAERVTQQRVERMTPRRPRHVNDADSRNTVPNAPPSVFRSRLLNPPPMRDGDDEDDEGFEGFGGETVTSNGRYANQRATAVPKSQVSRALGFPDTPGPPMTTTTTTVALSYGGPADREGFLREWERQLNAREALIREREATVQAREERLRAREEALSGGRAGGGAVQVAAPRHGSLLTVVDPLDFSANPPPVQSTPVRGGKRSPGGTPMHVSFADDVAGGIGNGGSGARYVGATVNPRVAHLKGGTLPARQGLSSRDASALSSLAGYEEFTVDGLPLTPGATGDTPRAEVSSYIVSLDATGVSAVDGADLEWEQAELGVSDLPESDPRGAAATS